MTFKEWFRKRVGLGNQNERDMLADWAAEREKLIGSLPDADKLELLAEWIDAKYPDDFKPQAQDDLRLWANRIRAVLAEEKEKV